MIYRSMVHTSIRNTIVHLSTSAGAGRVHPTTALKVPCRMHNACRCMQVHSDAGVAVYAAHGGICMFNLVQPRCEGIPALSRRTFLGAAASSAATYRSPGEKVI